MANSNITEKIYNTDIKNMDYNDDDEYRRCIRRAFNIIINDNDDDDIEEIYENDKIKNVLEYIYNATVDNDVFKKMYLHGASKIICEKMDLGMTILFSYDFFVNFHRCLIKFFNDGVIYEDDEDVKEILVN